MPNCGCRRNSEAGPGGFPFGLARVRIELVEVDRIVEDAKPLGGVGIRLVDRLGDVRRLGDHVRSVALRTVVAPLDVASTPDPWCFAQRPSDGPFPRAVERAELLDVLVRPVACAEYVRPHGSVRR